MSPLQISSTGRRRAVLAGAFIVVFGLPGCRQAERIGESDGGAAATSSSKPDRSKAIVEIGDTAITVDDLEQRLREMHPRMRRRYEDTEALRELVNEEVRFELLVREAKRRGYDRLPKIQRRVDQLMVEEMMNTVFGERGSRPAEIPAEEVRAYYAANISEFKRPAQRRAGYALFAKSREGRAQTAMLVEQTLGKPKDKEFFRRVAADLAETSKAAVRAGDLGFFFESPVPDEKGPPRAVRVAVFALNEPGDISASPIETDEGYYVVQLTGSRPALSRSVEEASSLIKSRLWRKKREAAIEEFVAGLREKAGVEEHLEALSSVRVEMGAGPATSSQTPETAEP